MSGNLEGSDEATVSSNASRREVLQGVIAGLMMTAAPNDVLAVVDGAIKKNSDSRFPYFLSTPVSYLKVRMTDSFWASRQKPLPGVTVPWAARHYDAAGGLSAYQRDPTTYHCEVHGDDLESIKFVESMATVVGLQRDASMEGFIRVWSERMIAVQKPDGYRPVNWPLPADPNHRWRAVWWSHEDYGLGHYIEAGIALRNSTGDVTLYESAVRAADNMVQALLDGHKAYAPGHEEIEQALMRLYGLTGENRYLRLCGWLIGQRGHHEGRPSYGKYSQDHLPVREQRTIEGHAVRAAFLFNGVTEYVGATGEEGYREAVIAVWDDLVNHKLYLHGAAGSVSTNNEGYGALPDVIPPNDAYGESCSIFGNFQWAHNLFRLTGNSGYLDVAERMLYNAFYASLSLQGDRYFYHNVAQKDEPVERYEWNRIPCCPPNIVKLFAKVGGFFYSTDSKGIFVHHYGSNQADIPFAEGLKLTQHTDYPWDGKVRLQVDVGRPSRFCVRLRVPGWAKSHAIRVNGSPVMDLPDLGWVSIERLWRSGDRIDAEFPMILERVTMPPRFKDYQNLVALQRGPIVYCIEQQDSPVPLASLCLPEGANVEAQYEPQLLGGIVVVKGVLPQTLDDGSVTQFPVTFIPYGVWNNRGPDLMRIWLQSRRMTAAELESQLTSLAPT